MHNRQEQQKQHKYRRFTLCFLLLSLSIYCALAVAFKGLMRVLLSVKKNASFIVQCTNEDHGTLTCALGLRPECAFSRFFLRISSYMFFLAFALSFFCF